MQKYLLHILYVHLASFTKKLLLDDADDFNGAFNAKYKPGETSKYIHYGYIYNNNITCNNQKCVMY